MAAKEDERMLETTEMSVLRWMLGIPLGSDMSMRAVPRHNTILSINTTHKGQQVPEHK